MEDSNSKISRPLNKRVIKEPEIDINSVDTKITEARKLTGDQSEIAQGLAKLYDATGGEGGKLELMIDVILSFMTDAKIIPTSLKAKKLIYDDFVAITKTCKRTAMRYFKKAQPYIKKMHNLGMVVHHAAAVGQDTVARMYRDLDLLNSQEERVRNSIEESEELVNLLPKEILDLERDLGAIPDDDSLNNSKESAEIKALLKDYKKRLSLAEKVISSSEMKISRLIASKKNLYEQLLKYSRDFGVELGLKAEQNTINEEKNKILEQKINNDSDWQKMDIYIRHQDMSPDEKRKALARAISSDKGLTETVVSAFEAKVLDEED